MKSSNETLNVKTLLIYNRRGYYTVARYEFYVRVARQHKIHIFKLTCNVLFIIQTYKHPNTNSREKAGNDVIDIFTSEDMENTPLTSRM